MPVYSWKGIDSQGSVRRGTLFARSSLHLKELLLKNNIGLLYARPPLLQRPVSLAVRQHFFMHLASLLAAHIPLHNALLIIASTITKQEFKIIIEDIASLIAAGVPLSEALQLHQLADELIISVIIIGEKTGALAKTLQVLVDHHSLMAQVRAHVRSALMMPLITLTFFLIIMLVLFIGIIPLFESFFASHHMPYPVSTRIILGVSHFMRSRACIWAALGCLGLIFGFYHVSNTSQGQAIKDNLLFKLPGSSFFIAVYQTRLLQALSMLLPCGIPLAQALEVCTVMSTNSLVKKQVLLLKDAVESGRSLSIAWHETILRCPEVEVLLLLGESSGNLARMIEHAAQTIQRRVYGSINRFVTLIHPLLIVVLGVFIAGLIFAVYMPILTLSSSIM